MHVRNSTLPPVALNLRTGCCPAPAPDHAGTLRYALAGDYFKGATTDDGTPAPDGAPRQWTVIPPVHTAVRVLEQLTTTRFLFPLRPAWLAGVQTAAPCRRAATPGTHGHRRHRGEVITAKAANYRIADFISWVNDYARRHGLDTEPIPTDPHGPVTISRFRLRAEIASPFLPGPLRDRLTQRADGLQQIASRHARTRITSKEPDDQR